MSAGKIPFDIEATYFDEYDYSCRCIREQAEWHVLPSIRASSCQEVSYRYTRSELSPYFGVLRQILATLFGYQIPESKSDDNDARSLGNVACAMLREWTRSARTSSYCESRRG